MINPRMILSERISSYLESREPKLTQKDIRRFSSHLEEAMSSLIGFTEDKLSASPFAKPPIEEFLAFYYDYLHRRERLPKGQAQHRVKLAMDFIAWCIEHPKGGETMVTNQEDMPSQSESVGTDSDAGQKPSKQIKITIYPDKTLKKDIEDLADVDGMPVSKFILKVIQQEVNNRREDLNVIRSIRAKRG